LSALETVRDTLDRIQRLNPALNCFTAMFEESALADAAEIDARIARGERMGPLAGVPFAAKNLFDVAGVATLAGSVIRRDAPVASRDAAAVAAMRRAGAVLVGTLNMDEFAYGFTTENSHYGPTHNPHDLKRVAGGSSGGSAAAVAAGIVPIALGSDTNGSIRVPAAFCGIYGLKPTYGRVSRRGAFLFASSLDHVGPLARTVEELAAAYDAMQGPDAGDPVCSERPVELASPFLSEPITDLRMGVAGGYFREQGEPVAFDAVDRVARSLGVSREVEIPEAARARAAAWVITASEGGNHHLADLRTRSASYDPNTRSRFVAGALVPAAWVSFAQRFRSWYRERVADVFRDVDLILAPATPCPAIEIGQKTIVLAGKDMPARAHIGVFTQPISFIGLPVVNVPVCLPGQMPMGVQLIGAPFSEAKLLRVAMTLQSLGYVSAPIPDLP
jgi:AtzE family amidohydrolase